MFIGIEKSTHENPNTKILMTDKKLFLLRGLPGAGKSTLAKALGARQFEADMYFVNEHGEYNFNPAKIKDAHKWCQDNVAHAMSFGVPVAVSNTFTRKWEMDLYYELAEKYGYRVFSLVVENRHGGVNTHNVPEETLKAMKERFEVQL
jgi:predicted kinase